MDLKALRERAVQARADLAQNYKIAKDIDVAGEPVDIKFVQAEGTVWANIEGAHPPRLTDGMIGYNTDAAPRDYPVELISIDGSVFVDAKGAPDQEAWHDLFDSLETPSLRTIAAVLYSLNRSDPHKRMIALGKAKAGGSTRKQRSPAK